ncbi:MAG: hypothetical protein O2807_12255 [bacterium]|nr:hypothetical protein [bacterium]
MGKFLRACALGLGLLLPLLLSVHTSAQTLEERRISRLTAHLRRLHRPEDWLISRKLFSSSRERQLKALEYCTARNSEWPWYLSSGHLENYTFSVDFIPLNMDDDPEEETLIILQSDPEEVHYITFCLVDDAKRGRAPLSVYSDISQGKAVTYQLTDITGDGSNELIIFTREGLDKSVNTLSVRVLKPKKNRKFEMIWFARLREEFTWPIVVQNGGKKQTLQRRETLHGKMRFLFEKTGSPVTIVLEGKRELRESMLSSKDKKKQKEQLLQSTHFTEKWIWDKKRFEFVRSSNAP